MTRGVVLAVWLAMLAFAQPANAQPAQADPIGELLARQAAALPDPEDPDQAAKPPPRAARPPPDRGPTDAAYDSRIRSAVASAQSFQGPLDGGWTLSAPDGDLYALQLVDRGNGAIEGAWRDLRKAGALDASGFIAEVERGGDEVTFRFGDGRVVMLHSLADGRFSGQLTEAGQTRAVSLQRRRAP